MGNRRRTTDNGPKTISDASGAIRAGTLTPVDLVESCLQQIDRYEEKVRAWVFVDRDGARAEAERLTAELKKGYHRGPLHGIPIGVKDIFDVFDWPTAAGSKLWANSIARKDAVVVEKLRQAGAILLGKTVTTAYASFDPPVTRNPWNLSKTPGGSSSGSAAAVACGMCFGALASQTGGSITRPASYCGVCGIKPSYGIVSLNGVVPLAHSMDHVGVIARSVTDATILLQAIVNNWRPPPDYLAEIAYPPRELEICRFRGMFDDHMEPAMKNSFDMACERLQKAGLKIENYDLPTSFCEVTSRHQMVMAVEAAQFHEVRLKRHPEDYPPRIRSLIEEGLATSATEFARTKEHQLELRLSFQSLFDDPIAITPATLGPAPDAATTGSPIFNSPWSYIGLPTVSFPIGWTDDGLPLCMQMVGKDRDEAKLLQMAAWCEKAIGFEHRELPLN